MSVNENSSSPMDAKNEEKDKLYWETKKLEAEARKIEAEARDTHRHPFQKLTFWVSAVPAAVAVIGIALQYYSSSVDYKKAELLRDQAIFDEKKAEDKVAKVNQQLEDLDKEVKIRQAKLEELIRLSNEMDKLRNDKDQEVKTLTKIVEGLRDEKVDRRQQLEKLDQSLRTLQGQQRESSRLSKDQFNLIGTLGQSKK